MEYQYTINDIKAKCQVSLQSLYTLIKKNKEFINENSTRYQRKIYYNQVAMDFFVSYYHSEEKPMVGEVPKDKENPISGEVPKEEPIPLKNKAMGGGATEGPELYPDEFRTQIDALHAQIDELKAQLKAKEEERVELLRQNGALILTVSQLQQEKMLLLPAPKKSFSEKVKSLFSKK